MIIRPGNIAIPAGGCVISSVREEEYGSLHPLMMITTWDGHRGVMEWLGTSHGSAHYCECTVRDVDIHCMNGHIRKGTWTEEHMLVIHTEDDLIKYCLYLNDIEKEKIWLKKYFDIRENIVQKEYPKTYEKMMSEFYSRRYGRMYNKPLEEFYYQLLEEYDLTNKE